MGKFGVDMDSLDTFFWDSITDIMTFLSYWCDQV